MIAVKSSRPPLLATLAECANYRTLFFFLTIRDLKLRFRQTAVGVLWALVQPLMPMLIFAAVFGRVLRPATGPVPYMLFVLSGLAPWAFFANAVVIAAGTFVSNYNLLNKVYFPRALLPAAAVSACIFDWLISTVFLLGLMLVQSFRPHAGWFLLPAVLLWGIVLAMSVGLGAAALIVIYRDLKHLFPFLVQLWMYATPVIYPLAMLPLRLQWAAGLNPMAGVVESYRWCLFGGLLNGQLVTLSLLSTAVMLIGAGVVFQHLESDLAERA